MGFQDWNISTTSLVILAAAVLRYRADKQTDGQTNADENPTPRLPSAWITRAQGSGSNQPTNVFSVRSTPSHYSQRLLLSLHV